MAAGEAIGCFGLTEPDAGSDPGSMRTFADATATTGSWGSKMWITNGGIADIASCGPRPTRASGDSSCRRRAGFTTTEIHKKLSLRASVTSELVLDGVRLPAGAVLPGVRGLKGPAVVSERGALRHRVGRDGRGRACFQSALEYARTREQFGRPIGAFQLTQQKLADMAWS